MVFKDIKLIILLFSIVQIKAQIKLNTKNEIDIFFEDSKFSLNKIFKGNESYLFKIVNNTNNTYIIDPYGFRGNNVVETCDKSIVEPDRIILSGLYRRTDNEDCFNDLVILKPKEEKYIPLSIITLKGSYDLNKNKKYILNLSSTHNKYTMTLLGCQDYIKNELEKKGYKVLEDNIVAKIPIVP
ncbi:hypothetical protein [Chryseobacterium sp. c4a]|uniref:hypothetical protein n=1 Tax=Chryseobacterium sp. c4a TaxID=1573582 RepID=UPI00135C490C|nr:hypothetical protein [Chryseobacterium sp. c4a]